MDNSKIFIYIPTNNIPEREYMMDFVFRDYLGIDFALCEDSALEYTKICFNNKKLLIKDALWNSFPEPLGYLHKENLPLPVRSWNKYCVESDIVILYGENIITNDGDSIFCDIDIFAAVFFMLTRWEEYIIKGRDTHDRFPASESVAFKYDFLHRPIVNEYIEMLWNMMSDLGILIQRKERRFQIVPTHDIDNYRMPNRLWTISKSILKNIYHRRSFNLIAYLKAIIFDPYNTFDFLMSTSENARLKSHFYLMAADAGIKKYATCRWIFKHRFHKDVKQISERGHFVGFHPSYFTYTSQEFFRKEKDLLNQVIDVQVSEGRQHYLMMKVPETLRIWDNEEMKIDSTLSYADAEGFRCGTGDEFCYFDFIQRKKLKLRERPLILMDGTLLNYRKYSISESEQHIKYYFEIGNKYRMPITILFHNSIFFGRKGLKEMYKRVLTI